MTAGPAGVGLGRTASLWTPTLHVTPSPVAYDRREHHFELGPDCPTASSSRSGALASAFINRRGVEES